ncbi:U3 small nucleolar RNA-associated protein 6, partial [Aphis craccivora]
LFQIYFATFNLLITYNIYIKLLYILLLHNFYYISHIIFIKKNLNFGEMFINDEPNLLHQVIAAKLEELKYLQDTNGESLLSALSKYEYKAKYSVLRLYSVCELHYRIVSDMFVECKQIEKMWQKLAVVALKGYIFDFELKKMHYNRHCKQRLTLVFTLFVNGFNEDWSPEKQSTVKNETNPCVYVNLTMEQALHHNKLRHEVLSKAL